MMEPLQGRLAELVAAEKDAVQPPPGAKQAHWAGVAAAFGPAVPPPAGSPAPAPAAAPAAAAAKGGALLKIVGGTLVAGAIGGGLWASQRAPDPTPTQPTTVVAAKAEPTPEPATPSPATEVPAAAQAEPAVPVDETPVEEDAPVPDEAPEAVATDVDASAPTRRVAKPAAPAPADLAAELALIETLRRAVRDGDHATALALARQHRDDFPKGALRPDRLDLEASAMCASGRLERGQALAAELSRRWPKAPVSDRLQTTCKLDAP